MERGSAPKIWPFVLACCLCLVLLEFVGAAFAPIQRADFRSFYAAGYLIRTHPSQLYDVAQQERVQTALISDEKGILPFYHLDYEALLFAPFSILNYRSAYFSFMAFNMLLLVAAFFAARPAFSSPIPFVQPLPGLMFFIFIPFLIAVMLGQDSILSLLLYALMWRELRSGRNMSAGSFLALSLFKPHLAVPIAALIALQSGWRFAAGFLITSAGIALLCVGLVGSAGIASLIRLLFGAGAAIDKNTLVQRTMSVYPRAMPTLAGLFYACGHFLRLPTAFALLGGLCAVGLFVWCAIVVRGSEQNFAFSVATLCGLLVSYHLYFHDLTLCLLPVALLARRTHWSIIAILFGLPVLLYFHLGLDWFFLMAVPLLAMLVNAILSARSSQIPIPGIPQSTAA